MPDIGQANATAGEDKEMVKPVTKCQQSGLEMVIRTADPADERSGRNQTGSAGEKREKRAETPSETVLTAIEEECWGGGHTITLLGHQQPEATHRSKSALSDRGLRGLPLRIEGAAPGELRVAHLTGEFRQRRHTSGVTCLSVRKGMACNQPYFMSVGTRDVSAQIGCQLMSQHMLYDEPDV